MKDHLMQIISDKAGEERRNLAREYVQVYLLRLLHERGAQAGLAFQGGTALRLLYGLERFSEDLDFALEDPGEDPRTDALFSALEAGCQDAGYRVGLRKTGKGSVAGAMFRFEGLPRDLGLTADQRPALSVKVEIDTRPPEGAACETTLIHRFFPIALRHHDLASLFSGKLHAVLTRPWPKGRDWFDLVWYLTGQTSLEPNLQLLENALRQTGHRGEWAAEWARMARERLAKLDWAQLTEDIHPFLQRPSDWDQLTPDLVDDLLARRQAKK